MDILQDMASMNTHIQVLTDLNVNHGLSIHHQVPLRQPRLTQPRLTQPRLTQPQMTEA